ncbi:MAG: metal-dependent transcriptional regulator [Dehalococcoidia bacterium]|nr:MAG: metal-dependent transcriptional regulator [Dehalococcoidia bacterium]
MLDKTNNTFKYDFKGLSMTTERTASMEDYLEAIAVLREEEVEVRVTQISKRLGVKKPSVTAALHKLSEDGLVKHRRYGHVELTGKGRKIAEEVMRRHEVLFRFLSEILGVDSDTAQEDACKVEHSLSPTSLERLAKFVEFVLTCPRGEPVWHKGFNYFVEHGERDQEIVANCLEKES